MTVSISPKPILYIITGPPGGGKTTYARSLGLPTFDHDLGNKHEWSSSLADAILLTSAPAWKTKEYWRRQGIKAGFSPRILTMWVPRNVAMQRMRNRPNTDPTTRNDLNEGVERWYKLYTRHPREERIDGQSIQSAPTTRQ